MRIYCNSVLGSAANAHHHLAARSRGRRQQFEGAGQVHRIVMQTQYTRQEYSLCVNLLNGVNDVWKD